MARAACSDRPNWVFKRALRGHRHGVLGQGNFSDPGFPRLKRLSAVSRPALRRALQARLCHGCTEEKDLEVAPQHASLPSRPKVRRLG